MFFYGSSRLGEQGECFQSFHRCFELEKELGHASALTVQSKRADVLGPDYMSRAGSVCRDLGRLLNATKINFAIT